MKTCELEDSNQVQPVCRGTWPKIRMIKLIMSVALLTVDELNENSTAIEREFYNFYRTPRGEFTPAGSSPKLTTHPTHSSNVKFMNFYPFSDIETISPRPMLFITGEISHSREFSEEAYRRAGEPKELFIVPNAGHVDLYDRVQLIPFDKLTSFFTENLK